jgi:hypothetical protein
VLHFLLKIKRSEIKEVAEIITDVPSRVGSGSGVVHPQ